MAKEDDKPKGTPSMEEGEEYEILPQKEIQELKDELRKLKEFEITPSKKMQVSLVEVNQKLDKMLSIFEEATTALELEEGGLSFKEKMRPVIERMNKILEQNSEIAQGIVAVADLVKDLREDVGKGPMTREHKLEGPSPVPLPSSRLRPGPGTPPARTMPRPIGVPGMAPPPAGPPAGPPGMPPPPPPRRKRFGL